MQFFRFAGQLFRLSVAQEFPRTLPQPACAGQVRLRYSEQCALLQELRRKHDFVATPKQEGNRTRVQTVHAVKDAERRLRRGQFRFDLFSFIFAIELRDARKGLSELLDQPSDEVLT